MSKMIFKPMSDQRAALLSRPLGGNSGISLSKIKKKRLDEIDKNIEKTIFRPMTKDKLKEMPKSFGGNPGRSIEEILEECKVKTEEK